MAAQHFFKPDADELPPSSLIDNMYRVVRLIGRGGMGSVYEAEDTRLGRPVALKVLRSDLAKQLQADERFLQEAKILARIRSPFVATVFNIGATETGRTYIAMEYIEGGSLGDLLDRERWLKLPRAGRIAQRVCEALMEAHKLGIIHRDLKPDNILLTRLGSVDDYVKVVDLGLAKHIAAQGDAASPRLTQARLVVGTPAYMSPEQAAGQEVGPASDLYSLAVILYEMATGFLPVDGESPQDFLRAHQLQAPVSVNVRRTDLVFPPQVDAFFRKVLAKSPGERPKDARAFVEELDRLEGISAESRSARPAHANIPKSIRRQDSALGPTLDLLGERMDRAKDRVRMELAGVCARSRAMLYEALDAFVSEVQTRADSPVVIRVRIPPAGNRLLLAAIFEEVRIRAGLFDDDPPSLARRKLLSWVQGLMPDRPDRASQVAHLIGLFLRVEFPDSPHLGHARSVPEVARMAGGAALADALRGIAGRSTLVLVFERVDHLSDTEQSFVRRLIRQLGTIPAVVVGGWVARHDEVPASFAGLLTAGSVSRVPAREPAALDRLLDGSARRVLAAAVRLGSPLWPDLLEAATGSPVGGAVARLVAAGALRPMPASRLSSQVEYALGDFPESIRPEIDKEQLDIPRALSWVLAQAVSRPDVWAGRMAELEAQAGGLAMAATHSRQFAELTRQLGGLTEAIAEYEISRLHGLALQEQGRSIEAALNLAETVIGLSRCLSEQGNHELASERAREGIEGLRGLQGNLREEDWYRLGVPLLAAWATAEVACNRGAQAIAPLETQLGLIQQRPAQIKGIDHTPIMRLALGKCLKSDGKIKQALETWVEGTQSMAVLHNPVLAAELSLCISEGYRLLGDGDRGVTAARKALASARDARNLILEVEALRSLALALREVGELDDAEAQLGEALNALGRIDRQLLAAEVSVLLANVLHARGAMDEADAALAKSCRAYAALPSLTGLSNALRERGEIQMANGIYTRALAFAEEAARQAQLAADTGLHIRALLLAARASAAAGDARQAHVRMEEAFQLVPQESATVERADCMVVLADLLEAGVLTSDRAPSSLLEEAGELYKDLGATKEAERLTRRLKAMSSTGEFLKVAPPT